MRLILKKWKICFVPRRYWVENLHWMKGRQAIQPDIRIDYDFLREVEIYVPDIEYRTCFYSSQDIGESWWPSKCCEWTFGLKPGYQQVRELVRKQRQEKLRPGGVSEDQKDKPVPTKWFLAVQAGVQNSFRRLAADILCLGKYVNRDILALPPVKASIISLTMLWQWALSQVLWIFS